LTARARSFFQFLNQCGFQIFRVCIHFARRNFLVGGALKTKFANADAIFGTNWRPEDAASHGASFIELTKSSFRIERRARLIIGELSEAPFRLLAFVQQACIRIAREILRQAGNRVPSALPHASGALRGRLFQNSKSLPESFSVKLIDCKHSDAALRAPRTTGEPLATSTRSICERQVHDLNQRLISLR